MHKKLESELISLAHQILQMKNKDDVAKLRDKAKDVYEKLSVLAFVDNYFITTPNAIDNKEEVLNQMQQILDKSDPVEKVTKELPKTDTPASLTTNETDFTQEKTDELVKQTVKTIKSETTEIVNKIQSQEPKSLSEEKPISTAKRKTLEEEMEDSIPADVAANLFEKATSSIKLEEQKPIIDSKSKEELLKVNIATKQEINPQIPKEETKTSLNDRLLNQKLQVGLNDRIAFVKHLFNYSQNDFNGVLSQLNAFGTEQECKNFINNVVKPKYNWSDKETYEERLIILIERKFL